MENVMEFLASRRSVRKYLDKPIPDDMVTQLLEAGRLAPSRGNEQPWRFIVITDPVVKEELFEPVFKQVLVRTAPLLIVVLGVIDPRGTVQDRTQELVEAGCFGKDVKDFADHVLDDWAYSELKVDAALNSSIAATQIMLAAHGLGLGCCWVKLCEDDDVLKVLGAPADYCNTAVLCIGYPDQSPKARPRVPLDSLVFYDRFGNTERPVKSTVEAVARASS